MKPISHEVKQASFKTPGYLQQIFTYIYGFLFYSWPFPCLTTSEKVLCAFLFPIITGLITMGLWNYVFKYLRYGALLAYQYGSDYWMADQH